MSAEELIWCRIDLADVVAVLDQYELWKDEPWYHQVDWARVSRVLHESLTRRGSRSTAFEMWDDVRAEADGMRQVDRDGLSALLMEPITITPVQLTNGGHRLNAMRLQGVATVPGMFHRGDVGVSVRVDQVYGPWS